MKPRQFASIVLLSIKVGKTVKRSFKLKEKLNNYNLKINKENFTSAGSTKFGGAEKGQEFELRTITEKSTKIKILK
jgi:hypothetical protein